MGKFVIKQSPKDHQWYVSLISSNNKDILMHSEGYQDVAGAINLVDAVQREVPTAETVTKPLP